MTLQNTTVSADDLGLAEPNARLGARYRATLIDLNNSATFPTLAIGLLIATLRKHGHAVELVSPLAHDVPGVVREAPESLGDHLRRRLSFATWRPALGAQAVARRLWRRRQNGPHPVVLRESERVLKTRPDVLLLSAYMQHYPSVVEICRMAKENSIPVILGGPMFNLPFLADEWRSISGLSAIYGGEADLDMHRILRAVCEGRSLLGIPGITLPDGRRAPVPAPLRPLDRTPIPDFTNFPWHRYPSRVIPLMTGRGCQWDRCVFCSDVVSASGRSFRTRSVVSVLDEMREQSRRHDSGNFLFLDLKLNSNPAMFRGIAEDIQSYVPGAQWVGTVHVDLRKDNGLSREDLRAAAAAGMRRISFGLETGSQRLLDAMDKGSSVEANSEFIRRAHEAGLSIRCTMFSGFPGETAADLERTALFLERHEAYLDRVRFNWLAVIEGTPLFDGLAARGGTTGAMMSNFDSREGRGRSDEPQFHARPYRAAKARVLRAVYRINRKRLPPVARPFDGLM